MTKIKLTDYEHFEEVFKASNKLQEIAMEWAFDSAYWHVDEYLHNIPKSARYEVGYASYSYIKFDGCRFRDLVSYFDGLQHDFCLFPEDGYKHNIDIISRYGEVLEDSDYYGCINVRTKDYNFMCEKYENSVAWFASELLKVCSSEYEYFEDIDNLFDYVSEMEYFEDFYIDEFGDICEDRPPVRYDKIDIDSGKVVLPYNSILGRGLRVGG